MSGRGLHLAATSIAAIALSACRARLADYGQPRADAKFRGVAQFQFEATNFGVCGSDELWWLSIGDPNDPAWLHVDALHDRPCEDRADPHCALVYIEADGSVSAPGNHGHLGMYVRELVVTRVLFASLSIPSTCHVPATYREHDPFTPMAPDGGRMIKR